MKIKAIHTAWDNKPCIIKPRFFPKETGLQFTVIEGGYSGSYFACEYEQFTFNWYAKFQIFFVRIWYNLKMNLWRKIYRQYPYRIKRLFNPIKNDEDNERIESFTIDGKWREDGLESKLDLFFPLREGWINICKYPDGARESNGIIYSVRTAATEALSRTPQGVKCLDTIKIEWEE